MPVDEFSNGISIANMHYVPLGFVNDAFKGVQVRGPIVDKETFAIGSTCLPLEYLMLGGFIVYCDHLNLAYIFHPQCDGGPTIEARTWGSPSTLLCTSREPTAREATCCSSGCMSLHTTLSNSLPQRAGRHALSECHPRLPERSSRRRGGGVNQRGQCCTGDGWTLPGDGL